MSELMHNAMFCLIQYYYFRHFPFCRVNCGHFTTILVSEYSSQLVKLKLSLKI